MKWRRFLVYGTLGWAMEIFWTGLGSLLKGDLSLRGFSSLWMFFIYGGAVLLEPFHEVIREKPLFWRAFVWGALILTVEYMSGGLIRFLTGTYPWLYDGPWAVDGLIRLDYFPLWALVGLLFERIHDFLKANRV